MLGGLRASAQMVSYEIALGLSLIGILIYTGSFSLRAIVDSQAGTWLGFIPKWNLFRGQFVAFFIYIMAAYAEITASLSTCRRRRPNWSPDTTPSTAR